MTDVQFSDEFCRFLQTSIPAVDAAEMLLLVADRPEAWWPLDEVLAGLRPAVLGEGDAARYLQAFQAAGLIESDAEGRIRFRAGDEALAGHVRTLAQVYEERPVTLIRVIYAMRDAKIRTFADAFRLRKK